MIKQKLRTKQLLGQTNTDQTGTELTVICFTKWTLSYPKLTHPTLQDILSNLNFFCLTPAKAAKAA